MWLPPRSNQAEFLSALLRRVLWFLDKSVSSFCLWHLPRPSPVSNQTTPSSRLSFLEIQAQEPVPPSGSPVVASLAIGFHGPVRLPSRKTDKGNLNPACRPDASSNTAKRRNSLTINDDRSEDLSLSGTRDTDASSATPGGPLETQQSPSNAPETPQTERQPGESLTSYLARLPGEYRNGVKFVNLTNLGPITQFFGKSFDESKDR